MEGILKSLELENFKAFGSRERIEFAPITLIFGENSAGKSSILHSLELLKQTRESREASSLFLPRTENGIVDLGGFQELLFDHDLNRALSIKVETNVLRAPVPKPWLHGSRATTAGLSLTFKRPSVEDEVLLDDIGVFAGDFGRIASYRPTEIKPEERREFMRFQVSRGRRLSPRDIRVAECVWATSGDYWQFGYDFWRSRREEVLLMLKQAEQETRAEGSDPDEVDEPIPEKQRIERLSLIREAIDFYSSDFSLEAYVARHSSRQVGTKIALDGFIPVGPGRIVNLPERQFVYHTPSPWEFSENSPVQVNQAAIMCGRALEYVLERLFPLGPFRRPAQRWYIFTGTTPQDVGYRGDLLPDLLFRRPQLVEQTNDWLARLRIGYKLRLEPLGPRSKDLFELRLVDQRRSNGVEIGLLDVGFGISQLLPFVVQSLAGVDQII